MYTNYASQAQADGNATVASMFTDVKGDEEGHRRACLSARRARLAER
jgi:rubrerythrin